MNFDSAFYSWFSGSKVTDRRGDPLLVHRGEHGKPEDSSRFQTRVGSISFGSERAAWIYSRHPNSLSDTAVSPRVISTFLSIRKPVLNRPNDPFIEFREIEIALGFLRAREIAIQLSDHIENTNNWMDDIGRNYKDVSELISVQPDALRRLYVDAYPVFDEITFVGWFRDAGFDGAIHGGTGATAGEAEFKIFCDSQAY